MEATKRELNECWWWWHEANWHLFPLFFSLFYLKDRLWLVGSEEYTYMEEQEEEENWATWMREKKWSRRPNCFPILLFRVWISFLVLTIILLLLFSYFFTFFCTSLNDIFLLFHTKRKNKTTTEISFIFSLTISFYYQAQQFSSFFNSSRTEL